MDRLVKRFPGAQRRRGVWLALLLAFGSAMLALCPLRAEAADRVLVLHSYRQGLPWTDRIQQGLAAVLAQGRRPLDLDVEYLGALTAAAPAERDAVREETYRALRALVRGVRYDAVVVSDMEALSLLLERRAELAPETPVVFCGEGFPFEEAESPDVASVAVPPDYGETLSLARHLDARVRRVLFLGSRGKRGDAERALLETQNADGDGRLDIFVQDGSTVRDLETHLARLGRDWVVLLAGRPREGSRLLSDAEAAARLGRAAKVPVYGVRDTALGQGVLGGYVTQARLQGEAAGRTVLRILEGEAPQAAARAERSKAVAVADNDLLRRFGLNGASLPAGVEVLNRPQLLDSLPGGLIAAYLIVLALLSGLVAVLVRSVMRRRRAERELLEQRAKYALAITGAKVGPWECDLAARLFTFNDVFYALCATSVEREGGYTMSAERYALEFLPPEHSELVSRHIARQLVSEPSDEIYVIEHELIRRDGERRYITVNYRILYDKDGRAVRTLGANVDVTETRRAMEKLRASEQLLRVLVQSAPVGILLENREYRVVTCNEAAANILGLTVAEILAHGCEAIPREIISEDGERVAPEDYPSRFTLRTGLPKRGVVLGVREGVDTHWIRVDTAPIVDASGDRPSAVVVGIENITKRRQDETALMESAERFRSIFDYSPSGLCLLDGTGRVLDANRALGEVFLVRPEEIIGQRPLELLPEGPLRHALEDALARGEGTFEGPYALPLAGRTRFVKASCRRIGPGLMLGVVEDVTAAKQAEQATAESLRRFKFLLDGVSHIAVQGYDEQRRVVFWNQASACLYGYSEKEALGRRLEDLIIPDAMRDEVIGLVANWVERGEVIPAGELVLRDKQGRDVPVYSSHVMYEAPGGAKEMFCIDMNLAELRRTQEALRRSEALRGAMFERVPLGMLLLDGSGVVLDCNRTAHEILGVDREHCVGQHLTERLAGTHWGDALAVLMATGESRDEGPCRCAGSGERPLRARGVRVGSGLFLVLVEPRVESECD